MNSPLRKVTHRYCLIVAFALLGLSSSAGLLGQDRTSGMIRGQVSNGATKQNLEGVTIHVAGQSRDITTARDGSFEIPALAPGVYALTFDYPGLDSKNLRVDVGDQPVRVAVELSSSIYVMPEFAVAGDREGNAAAIIQQRNAVNVQNVVTSDAFGNIAKGNVGNFLKRIPGIAGTTDEVDTENMLVRGIAANFTSLDIDGTRSANGSPDGRNQSAASLPTDMVERAEVIKATTPDVDADSMGGRINLVTKSAFDRQGRRTSLRAASSYSMTYGKDVGRRNGNSFAPSVAGTFSDVYSVRGGENNLGLIAQANWERILEVRGTTAWNFGNQTDNGGTIPANQLDYPQFNNASVALHELIRGAFSVRADYKLSERLSLGGTWGWNTYENNMWRTRNQMAPSTVNVPLSADPYFTVIDGARYRAIRETRDQKTNKTFVKVNGLWRGPDQLQVNADASLETARRKEYRESINPTSALRLNYALDRRLGPADPRWPTLRVLRAPYTGNTVATTAIPGAFVDVNPFADNFSNTNDAPVFFRQHNTNNPIFSSRADATKELKTKVPVQLKAGLRYRSDITKTDRDELNGAMNLTTSSFGRNLSGFLDDDWDLRGAIGRYPLGFVPDEKKLSAIGAKLVGGVDPLTAWNFDPAVFTINNANTRGNSLLNDRKIWEEITAGYAQGKVDIGKLQLLGGVRVERTAIERSIPVRNRAPGVVGTLAEYTGRDRQTTSYQDAFPSLHLRYEFRRTLILHAAYSTTIGRPNFGDILGNADADPVARTVSVPNLQLKPQHARNYDLSLEYYFEPVGVVSVGVFRKNLDNFPVSGSVSITAQEAADLGAPVSSNDTATWLLTSKSNGGDAYVEGIELNYSQSFSFLPGVLRGLGAFANATYLKTRGTYTRGAGGVVTTDLENFIPRTANAGINYNYGRTDLRLQWNYTDAFPESVDIANPSLRNKWRGDRWQLDFSGRYKLTRQISLFADLLNLSTNHGKKYRGIVAPVRREETNANGFLVTVGGLANF